MDDVIPKLALQYYEQLYGEFPENLPAFEISSRYDADIHSCLNVQRKIDALTEKIKLLEEEKEKTFKKILPLFASADNGKGKYELDEKQTAYVEIKSKRKRPDIDETRLQTDYPDIYADCMKFDKGLLKKKYIQIYNAYELPSSPSGEFKYKISLHKKKE